jgi:hypothetical protein
MRLYERADFAPAVVKECRVLGGDIGRAGRPDFIDFGGAPPGPNFISLGEDASGTRYAMAYLSNAMWLKMEAALERLG